MDGSSSVVIPSASVPGGLAREDALFRIVYYGEALRAMTEHVSDALISGPCVPMIDLLDEAFDRMSETRDSFGPEEFTLFVMSKMLGLCDDVDEARQFQIGAAKYILKSAESLPDDYQPVVDDARQMLQRSAPLAVTAQDSVEKPEVPAHAAEEMKRAEAEVPAHEPNRTPHPEPARAPRDAAAIVYAPQVPAVTEPKSAPHQAATPPRAQPRAQRASVAAPSPHTRGAPAQGQRMHLASAHSTKRSSYLDRVFLWALFAFILGLAVMTALGYVDTSARGSQDGESVITRQ